MNQRDGISSDQIPLSLPHRPALDRDDFLVGASNAKAVGLIDCWPDWPSRNMVLVGPPGSGKSHLVEIWRAISGAPAIFATAIATSDADVLLANQALAIEDLDQGPIDEAALFHLLNLATEQMASVLMTSRILPSALPLGLDDLGSRMRAAQPVELVAPDDDLLKRVIMKLFADRQLTVDPAVINFIIARMERSLETANNIVDRLDKEALAQRRAITIRLASEALAPFFGQQSDIE